MARLRPLVDRARALLKAEVPPEHLVPELTIHLAREIRSLGTPSVYVTHPEREKPQDFTVWRGSENNTDALRAMLAAGIWPGPKSIPSIQRMMTERMTRCAFAATFYGDGADEEGPWTPLWRERGIRHGFYLAATAASGQVAVCMFHRGDADPAFTAADLAAGEAIAPVIAEAIDQRRPHYPGKFVVDTEVAFSIDKSGAIASIGFGGLELLNAAGGGGPGATVRSRAIVESNAREFLAQQDQCRSPAMLTGGKAEAPMRRSYFRIGFSGRSTAHQDYMLARSDLGFFNVKLTAAAGRDGDIILMGNLQRQAFRAAVMMRALAVSQAPAREMELAFAIERNFSIPDAAKQLGISVSTAKTLVQRLYARFGVADRNALLEKLVADGLNQPR